MRSAFARRAAKFGAVALVVAGLVPAVAVNAAVINVVNTGAAALASFNPANSLDLGGGVWDPARTAATGSSSGVFRSPWEPSPGVCNAAPCSTTPYWTVGTNGAPSPNAPNPGVLKFANGADGLSLLWGSVDTYNTLEFKDNNGNTLATVTGSQVIAKGATQGLSVAHVVISGFATKFYSVVFSSSQNAFEFSNVAPVPLPAAAWLFISAIGGLMLAGRRRKMHAAQA